SIGIAAAIACVGSEAVQAISGADKAASGPVFAWIGALYALYPLLEIGGYGLLLHKRSATVLWLTAGATVVRGLLNLRLIPAHGYMGATWAAVASFAVLGLARYGFCPRELSHRPDGRALLAAMAGATGFVLAVEAGGRRALDSPWARLFAAGGLWLLLYVAPVLLLDPRLTGLIREWKHRR